MPMSWTSLVYHESIDDFDTQHIITRTLCPAIITTLVSMQPDSRLCSFTQIIIEYHFYYLLLRVFLSSHLYQHIGAHLAIITKILIRRHILPIVIFLLGIYSNTHHYTNIFQCHILFAYISILGVFSFTCHYVYSQKS